jgi:hypothetical protein
MMRTKSKRIPTTPGGPTSSYSLPLTLRAFEAVLTLDEKLVGTPDYMGVAYWWSHEYKWSLREATHKQRKRAHDAILAAGLSLDGESDEHAAIVAWATNNGQAAARNMGLGWKPYAGPRPAKREGATA